MADRQIVLDPQTDQSSDSQQTLEEATRQVTERLEAAERELASLKQQQQAAASRNTAQTEGRADTYSQSSEGQPSSAETELRNDSMMAHLLDSLAAGKDIGHYGRLVFAMVARHFMSHDEVLGWLLRDPDFDDAQARTMLRQVEGRDYNPPRRDRILEWQSQQDFPILPSPEDPDCGNLYRNLKFPDHIYHHIEHYQEQKTAAEDSAT